jgi:hypothetical protein
MATVGSYGGGTGKIRVPRIAKTQNPAKNSVALLMSATVRTLRVIENDGGLYEA